MRRLFLPEKLELFLDLLVLVEHRFDFLFHLRQRRAKLRRHLFQASPSRARLISRQPGDRFDAAHAGGDRALGDDPEKTDLAGRARVRAAAEFHRIAIELIRRRPPICTTRTVSPYLSPKNCMTSARDFTSAYGTSVQVTAAFSTMRSLTSRSMSRTCAAVSARAVEVEGQLVRTDERPFLRRLVADHFVQRPVEQMRHGVMPLDGAGADRGQLLSVPSRSCAGRRGRLLHPGPSRNVQPVCPVFCVFSDAPELPRAG